MNTTLAMEDLRMSVPELVDTLAPGDEIVLTRNHHPVAKLVHGSNPPRKLRSPGNCKGMITLLVEDDEHLEGFAEYLP